jgi:hypothetical protein
MFATVIFARFPSAEQVNNYSDFQNNSDQMYNFEDTTAVDTPDVKYIKRDYDHKEQIIVGSMIMTFFAILLVAMNNYNPKR